MLNRWIRSRCTIPSRRCNSIIIQSSLLFNICFNVFFFLDPFPICLTLLYPFPLPNFPIQFSICACYSSIYPHLDIIFIPLSLNKLDFVVHISFFVLMASEEVQDNKTQPPALAPAPPSPAVSATLPPYPEMIIAAIEALDDPNGSNKSSISRQIEATYGNLPPVHHTLLTHHLNRMKSAGQLLFMKNNYLKPDPNAPPRRGRGRPPKPKTPLPPGTVLSPPRARGRPPKSRNPTASPKPKPTTITATVSGRKRGRPPKAATASVAVSPPPPTTTGPPRGRGRPPKVKPAVAAPVGA